MIGKVIPTAIGSVLVTSDGEALTGLYPETHRCTPTGWTVEELPLFERCRDRLESYFAGILTSFDLPLAPVGTESQLRVWSLLAEIPYGQTRSYGQLAQALGDPNLARAVGAANGANPISIVVPCHRVIGASGAATGYAGGLALKEALLAHERRVLREGPCAFVSEQGQTALF